MVRSTVVSLLLAPAAAVFMGTGMASAEHTAEGIVLAHPKGVEGITFEAVRLMTPRADLPPTDASPSPAPRATSSRLAPPIEPGEPPTYERHGRPQATATANGVRIELWVEDPTVDQGQWLVAHVRVTNLRDRTIQHYCSGITWRSDAATRLFDQGRDWPGVAGVFKAQWLERNEPAIVINDANDLSAPTCKGSMGGVFRLRPGKVLEQTMMALPRYFLEGRPLPGGTFDLSVAFTPRRGGRRPLVEVSTPVTLAGGPVDYPSPAHLVDAALESPGFIEWLEQSPDTETWYGALAAFWPAVPYPAQARFDRARTAPNGILEVALARDLEPAFGQVIIDPWTGASYGFSSLPPNVISSGPVDASPKPQAPTPVPSDDSR